MTGIAAWVSQKPQHPPSLLSPPSCPQAPEWVEDHTTSAGLFSHRREACLSTAEELPHERDKENLWADTQKETRVGVAQISQDKYCPFVSANCRDHQIEDLQIIIIYKSNRGWDQIYDTYACFPSVQLPGDSSLSGNCNSNGMSNAERVEILKRSKLESFLVLA